MKTLQAGIPGVATFGGAQGPQLVKSVPVPTGKTFAAGVPGVITFVGTEGVTLTKVPAVIAIPIVLDVNLDRRGVLLTLHSRSLKGELSRRIIRTEIVK